MEPQKAKKTLSRISEIESDKNHVKGFEFTCWFDETVDLEKEVSDSIRVCGIPHEVAPQQRGKGAAALQTFRDSTDISRSILDCVRSFLLMHGWEPAQEKGGMEVEVVRRTLSRMSEEYNYNFICLFDKGVDILKEIEAARRHCALKPSDILFAPGDWNATIRGGSVLKENNKRNVECVRSYLLAHGWKEWQE